MTEKCFEERFRDVEENYKVITNRIAEAAVRSGRKPEDITFLAATKTVPAEKENGSAQDIWKRLQYSKNLARDEMQYLEKSAIPRMEMKKVHVEGGVLELENVLMAQEIRLLDIQYRYSLK